MRHSFDHEDDYRQGRDDYRHGNIDRFRDDCFGDDSDRAYFDGVDEERRNEERRYEERREEQRMEEEQEYRRAERAAEDARMEEEQMYEAFQAYEGYVQEQEQQLQEQPYEDEDHSKEGTRANLLRELTMRLEGVPVMFKEVVLDEYTGNWWMTGFTYEQFIGNTARCNELIKMLNDLDSE